MSGLSPDVSSLSAAETLRLCRIKYMLTEHLGGRLMQDIAKELGVSNSIVSQNIKRATKRIDKELFLPRQKFLPRRLKNNPLGMPVSVFTQFMLQGIWVEEGWYEDSLHARPGYSGPTHARTIRVSGGMPYLLPAGPLQRREMPLLT